MAGFDILGDLQISEDGRELTLAVETDAIVQSLKNGAQVFKGFWRYDLNKGLPYFTDIFVLGPEAQAIRSAFVTYITGTQGIESVQSLEFRFERNINTLFVDFRARAVTGQEISDTFEYALAGT